LVSQTKSVFLEIWQESDAILEPLHFFTPSVKLGSNFFLVLKLLWF
jgi:hypothetical protein